MNPLSSGVEQESSGDTEVMQDVFSGFAGVLGTAVLLIYAVLVLLFANFLHPVTIVATLPLSLGGAVAADFDDDDRHDSWELALLGQLSALWRWR